MPVLILPLSSSQFLFEVDDSIHITVAKVVFVPPVAPFLMVPPSRGNLFARYSAKNRSAGLHMAT